MKFLFGAISILGIAWANVKIINPESLKEKISDSRGFIDAGLANFGHIEYGTTIVSHI